MHTLHALRFLQRAPPVRRRVVSRQEALAFRAGWGPRICASDRVDSAIVLLLDGPYPVDSRLFGSSIRVVCVVGVATSFTGRAAASQLFFRLTLTGLVEEMVRSDVRNERLPGPCSWVDTIAEVVEHRSAAHVRQRRVVGTSVRSSCSLSAFGRHRAVNERWWVFPGG